MYDWSEVKLSDGFCDTLLSLNNEKVKLEKDYAEQEGLINSGIPELDYLKNFAVKMSLKEINLFIKVLVLSEEVKLLKQFAGIREDERVFDKLRN